MSFFARVISASECFTSPLLGWGIRRLDIFTDYFVYHIDNSVDGYCLSAGDVDDLAFGLLYPGGEQVGLHDVIDISKVPAFALHRRKL